MSQEEAVALYEIRGRVGIITLNRPHVLNAINGDLSTAVGSALASADADPAVRVIVITGAGRAFCAGMDLKAFAAGEPIDPPGHPEWGFGGIVRHVVNKPVIAAVNGVAMGGGAELVLAADLAVAARGAVLGFPEVTRGIVAGAGGALRLARQIPRKNAMEMLMTGEPVTAERAAQVGLVNRVVADQDVLTESMNLAHAIAANAPLAVRASKRVLVRSLTFADDNSDEAWAFQDRECRDADQSEDAIEGARAFAEKRAPDWSDQ